MSSSSSPPFLLQTRSLDSLTVATTEAIRLLTLDPVSPPSIVGSFKFVVHEYPADIDLFSAVHLACCTNPEDAAEHAAELFRTMFRGIEHAEGRVFLGDFKAGLDERYRIDLGRVVGVGAKAHLVGYDAPRIRRDVLDLNARGALTSSELEEWLALVLDAPSGWEHERLSETVRSKLVARWKVSEVLAGVKTLPGGVRLSLQDALRQKTIVKADVWTFMNGRWVEMSNWYMLTYADANGRKRHLSLKPDPYENSLRRDLEHYASPDVGRRMKLAKRLWLFAILKKDRKLMTKLYPLFSSSAAKMYQIVGEAETIQKLIAHPDAGGDRWVRQSVRQNVEDWKTRLGTVTNDVLPPDVARTVFDRIDRALESFEVRRRRFAGANADQVFEVLLQDVVDRLQYRINAYVDDHMRRKHIAVSAILARASYAPSSFSTRL